MKKAEIRGYTAEEIAEHRKQSLVEDYSFCKSKLEEIRKHEQEIETIRKAYREMIVKYRIKSVDRVLEYIRAKKITDARELDLLLCHCQNKLNGNIDGIELNLHYVERSKDGETDTKST